jgi:hypothetical protein
MTSSRPDPALDPVLHERMVGMFGVGPVAGCDGDPRDQREVGLWGYRRILCWSGSGAEAKEPWRGVPSGW